MWVTVVAFRVLWFESGIAVYGLKMYMVLATMVVSFLHGVPCLSPWERTG